MSLIPIGLLLLLIYTIEIHHLLFLSFLICLLFITISQGTVTNEEIHHHSLVKDEECQGSYTCEGCKMESIGSRYKCSEGCEFYLHLECMHAEKKRTFQGQEFSLHTTPHFKGRSCYACEKKVEGYLYHCLRTDRVFHPLCFPKFEYCPIHRRYVLLVKRKKCKDSYECDGCLMKGTGRRYKCSFRSCKFELHFECMNAEKERIFEGQKFELLPKRKCTMGDSCTGKCMSCDTCEKKVHGCVYHCSKTDQVFHPLCFPYDHPSHGHGLVKDENFKDIYECKGCLMEGTGRRYRCTFQECDFQLHFECMHAEKECTFQGRKCELLEKPLPLKNCKSCQKQNLDYYKNPITSCEACGERVKGFVYHCSKTGQYFHPTCTQLESEMSFEGVDFVLEDDKEEKGTSSCALCGRPGGDETPGWSYVSKQRDECIHVCCVIALKNKLSNEISKGDSSLPLAERQKLPLQIKSKSGSKRMKVLKGILKILISILIGDPTTMFASVLIDLVQFLYQ